MKKHIVLVITAFSFLTLVQSGSAQTAFHKNSLSVSLTGGSTRAMYTTRSNDRLDLPATKNREYMDGLVDPLILEFGLSDKVGVGFTLGGDAYQVDAKKFYNYDPTYGSGKLISNTNYFTFDFNLHPVVTRKLDLSLFAAAGVLSIHISDCPEVGPLPAAQASDASSGNSQSTQTTNNSNNQTTECGNQNYNTYFARGPVLRSGVKLRYYCWNRFGFMAMATAFTGIANAQNISDKSFGSHYSTGVSGIATEFGICFRFF